MTRIVQKIVNFCAVLFVIKTSCLAVFGCSMVPALERPRSVVNPNIYIFVGEVIGYTEPISDPENFRGTAIGVKLKIIESIHFPNSQNDYVEVFMFGHGPDCFPEVRDNPPPIGTRYRLALYPARILASRSHSHIRLESGVFDRIAPDQSMFGFSTTAKSEFDYKNHLGSLVQRFGSPDMIDKRRWLDDFLYIEASKDLLRLQRVTSEKERIRLLERLLYCPNINYRRLLLSKVGAPLQLEQNEWTNLLVLTAGQSKKPDRIKLPKIEERLLKERIRLEEAGELNIWK